MIVGPLAGVSLEPDKLEPVAIHEVAESVELHESTIERVARAVRFQNLHLLVGLTQHGKKLRFTRLT